MNDILSTQVDLIREVFHYQSRFEGSTMVFKIDFPVTQDPGFPGLVKDLALLAKTGFKIIIVPGVKENIDAVLKQQNIESKYVSELRITTQQAIPFVEMAAFKAASSFMTFLSGSRVDAVIGNFVRARGLGVINGIDMEHTGTVDKVYADSINRVLNLGMIPILPCIGWSPSGKPYNVPSDEIALAASTALGAIKLFIVSASKLANLRFEPQFETKNSSSVPKNPSSVPNDVERRPDGSIIRLTPKQAEALIAENLSSVPAALSPMWELKLALKASQAGVHRVHIIDGREEGAILKELFSNMGVGTMIYNDEYDSIRSLHSRDLPDILRLMEPLMQSGILIRRNAEVIQEKKDDYAVLKIDSSIRACGALHNYGDQGEIAAVATDPQYTDLGLGRKIVSYLIEKAKKSSLKRVFVLTTQSQDWFEAMGFKETSVDSLPTLKREVYDHKRGSKVFALDLK